jgi:uncharacterized lipoprotein YmbA
MSLPKFLPYLACVALAVAGGCARSAPARFYMLSPVQHAAATAASPVVGLHVDTLPEYLRRPELAVRASANEVRYDEFSRWAEPLERALPRVLAADLAMALGQPMVPLYPWDLAKRPERILTVCIERFDADSAGQVTLVANTSVGDGWEKTTIRVAAASPAAADVVAAQSEALDQFAKQLAKRVQP